MSARALSMVSLAAALLAGGPARAQSFFEQSPGPLTSSHQDLEGQDNCQQCHTDGEKLSNDKCLGCHDHADLKDRIAKGKGFHSSAQVTGRTCWTCHLEHKGRGHDVMGWIAVGGREKFDHKLTGWPLKGKHQVVGCDDCHKRKNKRGVRVYLGEASRCGDCHRDEQPHRFEADKKPELMRCDRCHGEVSWKPPLKILTFDHNDPRQADFRLEGAHVDVTCLKCHDKAEFNLAKDVTKCSACHENAHAGHLFEKTACDACHSPKAGTLRKVRFDHDRKTEFDLDGAHDRVDCYGCHKPKVASKPKRECGVCHAADDPHKDRFAAFGTPSRCGDCHPTSSWDPSRFDHDGMTKFRLTGEHTEAGCRDCHRGKEPSVWERFDPRTVGCMGCHQHKKVHDRKYKDSECLTCHKMGGVVEAPQRTVEKVHGPRSRFPLRDGHAKVECKQCHKGDDYKGLSVNCGEPCHEDSLHRGSLGKDCMRCHAGGVWTATAFDHQEDSDYPLLGNHRTKATCEGCHPSRQYKPTPRTCGDVACHLDDDAHRGRLGRSCERCHREDGANTFVHNRESDFLLDGKHLSVNCKACHPSVTFKPRPRDCFGCHPEPNVHRGRYGTKCEQCHDTVDWARIKPIHDVGSFSLAGAHDQVACERCHKDSRPLAGTGNLCLTCHREDDLHSNSLGPRCGDCHTQWSFAPARFDHTTVGCDLQGVHRTLACLDCHNQGNFGAISPQCFSCHRQDALRSPTHAANPGAYIDCGACHRINSFVAGDRTVGTGHGNSSVCR